MITVKRMIGCGACACACNGGAGGGGIGNGPAGLCNDGSTPSFATAGTLTSPGAGEVILNPTSDGAAGGAMGSAGGTGNSGTWGNDTYGAGGPGGAGGAAVAGNAYITWIATGTRNGAVA